MCKGQVFACHHTKGGKTTEPSGVRRPPRYLIMKRRRTSPGFLWLHTDASSFQLVELVSVCVCVCVCMPTHLPCSGARLAGYPARRTKISGDYATGHAGVITNFLLDFGLIVDEYKRG